MLRSSDKMINIIAKYIAKKYGFVIGAQSAYKTLEGPSDNSLGVSYSLGQATLYKDRFANIWTDVNDAILQGQLYKEAEELFKKIPIYKDFKILFNSLIANIRKANLKDTILMCADTLDYINSIRKEIADYSMSDLPEGGKSILDKIISNISDRIWSKLKSIFSIHDLKKGIISNNEIIRRFPELSDGTWHYGPGKNPNFEKPKPNIKKTIENQKTRSVIKNFVDTNFWEAINNDPETKNLSDVEKEKIFIERKRIYNQKAKANKNK